MLRLVSSSVLKLSLPKPETIRWQPMAAQMSAASAAFAPVGGGNMCAEGTFSPSSLNSLPAASAVVPGKPAGSTPS